MLKEFGIYVGNTPLQDKVFIPTEIKNGKAKGVHFALFEIGIILDKYKKLFNDDVTGFAPSEVLEVDEKLQKFISKTRGYLGQINDLHTQAELKLKVEKLLKM